MEFKITLNGLLWFLVLCFLIFIGLSLITFGLNTGILFLKPLSVIAGVIVLVVTGGYFMLLLIFGENPY